MKFCSNAFNPMWDANADICDINLSEHRVADDMNSPTISGKEELHTEHSMKVDGADLNEADVIALRKHRS